MFNKLEKIIKKQLGYFGGTVMELSSDETFLSVRTELVLTIVLLIQITVGSLFWKSLVRDISNFFTLRENKTLVEKRLSQIQSNLLQVKKMPQAAEDLLESVPGSKDNYNLLEKLNSAAGSNQVSLLSVNFLPTKSSGFEGLSEQPVEIKLQGNYENVFSFTSDLEKSRRPILTESIEYSTDNKALTAGIVGANIIIRAFFVDTNQ